MLENRKEDYSEEKIWIDSLLQNTIQMYQLLVKYIMYDYRLIKVGNYFIVSDTYNR